MGIPTIHEGQDVTGRLLEAGRWYSVYQTEDTSSGGQILKWTGSEFVDDYDVEIDLGGEFCHGFYDYAQPQS